MTTEGVALDVLRHRQQLGMAAPGEQRALDPEAAVALLLGAGERVDHVVGDARRLRVLGGEVLPDEAADRAYAALAQRRDLGELVVLIAEDRVESVVIGPGRVLGGGDVGV